MKLYGFYNPENLRSFLADTTKELYIAYAYSDKYYAEIQIEVADYKFELQINDDFIIAKKKGR